MGFSEQEFLERCKTRIEEKYYPESRDRRLKQRDFEYLIDLIEETSGIRLSLSTLKRFWRDPPGKNPHPTTLDALVSILGYKDWLDFKVHSETDMETTPAGSSTGPVFKRTVTALFRKRNSLPVTAVALGLTLLVVLSIISFTSQSTGPRAGSGDVLFRAENTVYAGVPNTVIFNYDLEGVQADSFSIQQDWNPNNTATIDPAARYHTSVYYFPGYHRARLLADAAVLKTEPVFIRTDGWLAAALHRDAQERPIYLDADSSKGGTLSIRKEALLDNGVDSNRFEGAGFFNIGDFGDLDAHNFTCETRFRFREFVNVPCPFMQFTIHTEANIYVVQFTSKGCVGELELMIGERYLSGYDSDLSAFGTDVSEWQELSLAVENKHATVFLNGDQIMELGFNDDFGTIVGVDYRFTGMGDVDYLRFSRLDGVRMFADEF